MEFRSGDPLVYIIILNYNGFNDTIECIEYLEKLNYLNKKIIIVDNNSHDGSGELLSAAYPQYHYFQTGKNLGYAGGNNIGIKYAMENSADYICILNNDVIVDENFLAPIINIMENDPSIGIAGPKVCEYHNRGIIQSTGSMINLYTGKVPPINAGENSSEFNDVIDVPYMSGACLVARRTLIEKIGMLPEVYFLFFEETEWCLQAGKNNFRVICVCQSNVFHKGSNAVSKVNGLQAYYMTRNSFIFEKRNANSIQLISFMTYKIFRCSLSFFKGILLGRFNKDMYRGFIDGFKYKKI